MGLNERSAPPRRLFTAAAAPAKDRPDERGEGGRLAQAQRAKAAKEAILADLADDERRREIARALRALLRLGREER